MSSTYFTDSVSDLCQGIVDKADTYERCWACLWAFSNVPQRP